MANDLIHDLTQDAKTSLRTFINWAQSLIDLEKNVDAIIEAKFADAQREAEAVRDAATTRAAGIIAAAEAEAKQHADAVAASKAEHERLSRGISELAPKHGELSRMVETTQAHLDKIESAVAATLAPFIPKTLGAG